LQLMLTPSSRHSSVGSEFLESRIFWWGSSCISFLVFKHLEGRNFSVSFACFICCFRRGFLFLFFFFSRFSPFFGSLLLLLLLLLLLPPPLLWFVVFFLKLIKKWGVVKLYSFLCISMVGFKILGRQNLGSGASVSFVALDFLGRILGFLAYFLRWFWDNGEAGMQSEPGYGRPRKTVRSSRAAGRVGRFPPRNGRESRRARTPPWPAHSLPLPAQRCLIGHVPLPLTSAPTPSW
jgi:hypothetical protein